MTRPSVAFVHFISIVRLLVSRIRGSQTEFRYLGENLVGGLRPDKGLRRVVGDHEVLANGGLQGADTAMGAAFNLLLAEQREPAFDEVEPRGVVGVKWR
jgi:hypothetical protein